MSATFRPGDVVVRGNRPELVEEVLDVSERGYCCRALYLSKRLATDAVHPDLEGARLATPEDHRAAQAAAARWNSLDAKDGP